MTRAQAILSAALVLLATERAYAQAEPSSSDPKQPWYECAKWDTADTTCDVPSKSPEDRAHPDAPVALTFGYGMRFSGTRDRRLTNALPPWQWIVSLAVDAPGLRFPDFAVAFEAQYALEGQSTRELYGGSVSTAFTVHQFAVGPLVRVMTDSSEQPNFALLFRITPGWATGRLAWRDAMSGRDETRHDATVFILAGMGITWRPAGLTLEGGLIRPLSPLELGRAYSVEKLEYSIAGQYLRAMLSIRIP
jgi:hypothetical protein